MSRDGPGIDIVTLDPLARAAGIRHAFFTRRGGVSPGIFHGLNCGFGSADKPQNVERNRALAMAALGLAPESLVTCHQIHSAEIVTVHAAWAREDSPRADGMVTRVRGVALGVLAADCAPVLLADAEAGVVGAAHGGWRGALGGVLDAVVAGMEALGAKRARILAGIGPCIGSLSYEVGPEFADRFLEADRDNGGFFASAPRGGRFLFDLGGYVEDRLLRLGLAAVARAPHDTVAEEERFFSYRRACLRDEPDYGRALSAIALAP